MYDEKLAFYYDMMYASKDYAQEAQFIKTTLADCGHPQTLLDVGCGTGEHLRHLLKDDPDLEVVGVDLSLPMINVANTKEALANQATFVHGRIQDISQSDFDHAMSMFNVVNHIPTLGELEGFFGAIRNKVQTGSLFIFDCWNGIAATRDTPRSDTRTKAVGHGTQIVIAYEPHIDLFNSTVNMVNEVKVISASGAILDEFSYELLHTLWAPKVLSDTLQKTAFAVRAVYKAPYVEKRAATADDYKIVFVAEAVDYE